MSPDTISFDKLNLPQFDWLEIEEFEMQLIDFWCRSMWIQKFIETKKKLKLIETKRLTNNISKNDTKEILETSNSIPDGFNCLKKHGCLEYFLQRTGNRLEELLGNHSEMHSLHRTKMNFTRQNPPAHHWYAAKSPGLSPQFRSSRAHQTALARLRGGHLHGQMDLVQAFLPQGHLKQQHHTSRLKHPLVGVVWKLGKGAQAQVSSSSLDHGSK
ncbi:dimer_Tnp_hAT domain-containing protein [Trichonephila clavipes]|nr:dimer_Tnp_hAT domain-containing protein [Trichonephila clavipes]